MIDSDRKQLTHDEAGRIRRFSSGNSQTASDNASNANASIDGSFWIALFAMMFVVAAVAMAGYAMGATARDRVATSQEMDDQSSRIYVLEYDVKNICAQLMARDILEACH